MTDTDRPATSTTKKPTPTERAVQAAQEAVAGRDNPGGHASLAAALVAFQAEMPKVAKAKTASIPGKDGRGGYSYTYADLADVSDAAVPLLTKHGIAFLCLPGFENGGPVLRGQLLHALGDTRDAALPLYGRTAQDIGSSLTYCRRYLLGCMTGVVTDDDDDGAIAQAARDRAAPAPEPWHGSTAQELVDIISGHAITAGVDLDTITRKFRDQHGLTVEQLTEVPPPVLADLEASISRYLRDNPPPEATA